MTERKPEWAKGNIRGEWWWLRYRVLLVFWRMVYRLPFRG